MNIAYHFTGDKLRDGSPIPPIGETLVFPGKIDDQVKALLDGATPGPTPEPVGGC